MSKAFYVFLSELREDGYSAYALRQKKVDDLKLLFSDVTDREKKVYDRYIEKMKKHSLYKLKLPDLQKMVSDKGLPYTGLAKVELIEALSPSNFIASLKTDQKIRKVSPPSDKQKIDQLLAPIQPIKKVTPPSLDQKSVKMIDQLLAHIQHIKKVTPPSDHRSSDKQKSVVKDQPIKKVTPPSDKQKSVKDQPIKKVTPPSDKQKSVKDQSLVKMINQQLKMINDQLTKDDQKKVSSSDEESKSVKMIDQPIKKVTPPSDKQKSVKDKPSTSSDQSLVKMINDQLTKDDQKKVSSSDEECDLVELTDEQKKVIDSLTDDEVSSFDIELLDAHYLEMIDLYCKDVKKVEYHPVSCHLEVTSEEGSLLIMGVKV